MRVVSNIRPGAACAAWLVMFAFGRGAAGQAVQLPTFHFFSLSTTVSVPDGGDAAFGGISRSSAGRAQSGILGLPGRPFDSVATGRAVGAGNVSASATIHDLEAMDRALLAESQKASIAGRADVVNATRQASAAPLQSIAAIRDQQASEDASRQQEATAALARGRQLLAEGKPNVAKIYFQTAIKKSMAASDVHQQAVAALRSIEPAKAAGTLAGH